MEYGFSSFLLGKRADSFARFLSLDIFRSQTSPAPLLCLFFHGLGGMKGQIAAKLAADSARDKALEIFSELEEQQIENNFSTHIVREAFREANTRVYEYARVMAAGGQMGAAGVLAAMYQGAFIGARVGQGQAYIFRGKKSAALFAAQSQEKPAGTLSRFVGANAQVLVDLASASIVPGDVIVMVPAALERECLEVIQFEAQRRAHLEGVLRIIAEMSLTTENDVAAVIRAG